MEVEKKTRKVLKFQDLILSQLNHTLPISRLDLLSRRLDFKQHKASTFVLKFPHVFEIYEHPIQRILYIRLTRRTILQIQQEKQALIAQVPIAVTPLRKLIMMSNMGRLRLEYVRIARKELGLLDNFEYLVILKNKYIEIVERDKSLAVCAIERAREKEYRLKGVDAEDIRFSFIVNFPLGFKISKYYRIAVWKWQRASSYDLRSLEAQKRMEKRAVATIHELLSLTVEKKITLERIAHFSMAMNLPKRLKEFLLQHQGIFYISTRGNLGKLHMVFLREAYKKGEFVEPNDLYMARRQLADLVLLSPRKTKVDRELVNYRRDREDNEMVQFVENGSQSFIVGDNVKKDREGEDDLDSNIVSDTGSNYSDEDDDCLETLDAEDVHALSRLDGRRWSSSCRSQEGLEEGTPENIKSFSQKYKPRFFDELIGQNIVVKSLINAITRGRIAPVYLFQGPCGTGKTLTARIFASTLNCLAPDETKPCGYCRQCTDFISGKSRDLLEVDGTNKKGIDRFRYLLKKLLVRPPLNFSRYKVFVIDECHLLSSKTWLAFLKFLEDPPQQVVFILITTDLDNVPRTVQSRLQNISTNENLDVESNALDLIALNADGSLRDAKTMLEQLSLLGKRITTSLVNELRY
ncbi:protein root primordium defective 1 [Quercus suber]|uniref:Protein root primordium defective 1 n=1 Tax=Quercus suber TaxID=58331 RepID=A0AAW0LX27_QUESU